MAIIIKFPAVAARPPGMRPAGRSVGGRSADIIIFPGVRIYRGTPVAARRKRASARREKAE